MTSAPHVRVATGPFPSSEVANFQSWHDSPVDRVGNCPILESAKIIFRSNSEKADRFWSRIQGR